MKTSYNPETDPTRTTPTRAQRAASILGELVALVGLGILWWHTRDGWLCFGILLAITGAMAVVNTDTEVAIQRQAGLDELRRRALAADIKLDDDDDH
jgi:hypothetical protein